jgi:hypothetical protein
VIPAPVSPDADDPTGWNAAELEPSAAFGGFIAAAYVLTQD